MNLCNNKLNVANWSLGMKCQFNVCHILLYFACLSLMMPHAGFFESEGGTLNVHDTGMITITASQTDSDTFNIASDVTSVEAIKDTKPMSADTEASGETRRSLKNNKKLFIISGVAVAAVAVIGVIVGLASGDDERSDSEGIIDRPPGDPVIGVMPGF